MTNGDERPGRVLIFESGYDDMASLEALIRAAAPAVETHKTGNSSTALKLLTTETFDAFFIRLDAGGEDGAWLASAIREINAYRTTPLVFTAGNPVDKLALFKAFHCYDILDIPLGAAAFEQCASPLLQALRAGAGDGRMPPSERRFMVTSRKGRHVLRACDLIFAETDGHNLILHAGMQTLGGIRMRLADLVRLVEEESFLRCHRSYAVHLGKVRAIRQEHSSLLALTVGDEGQECPCSRPYFEAVERVLSKLAPDLAGPGRAAPGTGTNLLHTAQKRKKTKNSASSRKNTPGP